MFLKLISITYPDGLPENLPQDSSVCQGRLLDDFLAQKLHPPKLTHPQLLEDYDPQKAKQYLAWLAASMGREGIHQQEFLIEGLQQTWLDNPRELKEY